MKYRNILRLSTLTFSLLVIINITFPSANAFPPEGDCKDYHNVTKIIPFYERSASINLDGLPNENFWKEHTSDNENGSLIIPLASESYGPNFQVIYLNITFVITDTYLFILCKWFDNSTRPDLGASVYDGLYFCWNINVPNFSAYFTSGMSTLDMGGGDVDSWDWSCLSLSPINGSSYYCRDKCFGTYGWYDPNLETEDVEIAYTYRTNVSYTLEIKRELTTNDPYDIQVDQSGIYKFNMGIMNDAQHEDHLISWTHALEIKFPESSTVVPAYDIFIILFFSVFALILMSIKIEYTLKRS
ncbi:MAG: hypothetical protein ACFFCV_17520 [Promethearchaeota archaeon]